MLSKLKGYIRRLTTPKKDENFETKETTFGELEVSFVDSVKIEDDMFPTSNIILQISYQGQMDDGVNAVNQFLEMASRVGLKSNIIPLEETNYMFIAGSDIYYNYLCETFANDPEYSENKILRKVISIISKIDIMGQMPYFEDYNNRIYSYDTTIVTLGDSRPVFVECIDTYYIAKDLFDANINVLDKLNNLYIMGIYIPEQETILTDTVYGFISRYRSDDYSDYIMDMIDKYKDQYQSNFTIPGYKNIFDINFLVTDLDSSSEYVTEEYID